MIREKFDTRSLKYLFVTLFFVALYYSPILSFEFYDWDDPIYVTENPFVLNGLNLTSINWAFTHLHGGYWIPLTWISHMIDLSLFGLNPTYHHLHNLILHLLNGTIFYFILSSIQSLKKYTLVGLILFLIHPTNIESVGWIAERKGLLSSTFALLSAYFYIQYFKTNSVKEYWKCFILFLLSLMAKPMWITLPAVALIHHLMFKQKINKLNQLIPLLIISLLFSVITLLTQNPVSSTDLSLFIRLQYALQSYLFYIKLFFWPLPLNFLYPHTFSNLDMKMSFIHIIIISIISTGIILTSEQKKISLFLLLGFLISFLPMVGLFQVGIQFAANRFLYYPKIFLILLIFLFNKPKKLILLLLLMLIWIFLFISQVSSWKTPLSLWKYTLKNSSFNPLAHEKIGLLYLSNKSYSKAEKHFKKAIEQFPKFTEAHINLGSLNIDLNKLDKAEIHLKRAVKLNPKHHIAKFNLANLYLQKKAYPKAIKIFERINRLRPNFKDGVFNLSIAYGLNRDFKKSVDLFISKIDLFKNSPKEINMYFDFLKKTSPNHASLFSKKLQEIAYK